MTVDIVRGSRSTQVFVVVLGGLFRYLRHGTGVHFYELAIELVHTNTPVCSGLFGVPELLYLMWEGILNL